MKKYFLKFFALLFALVLPFAGYFAYIQSLPAQYSTSIMGTLRHKLALLQTTPGPRLILAGGSSSPHATDCAYLAEELDMNCINIGATVYLGLDLYLSMLEKNMQAGDIIVIGPEHSMMSGSIGYRLVWAAIENHYELWHLVPLHYWPHMVGSYYTYSLDKRGMIDRGDGGDPDGYNSAFGPLGDVTLYRESQLASGYNTEDPIALSPETLGQDFVDSMNRFYAKAQRRGVQVFMAFAPVDELALTTPPADWAALEALVREQIDMPILGSLEEAIMPGKYFYDTNNHLTTEGAQLYSQNLAGLLQDALQTST